MKLKKAIITGIDFEPGINIIRISICPTGPGAFEFWQKLNGALNRGTEVEIKVKTKDRGKNDT